MRNICFVMLLVFIATLFADRVSLNDATNVAINLYRESFASLQLKKGIIDDLDEATKLENIELEIDSLVDEQNVPVYYIVNFKPQGWMWVGATTSNDLFSFCSEEGYYSTKKFYENMDKKLPINIDLNSFIAAKKQRNTPPSVEFTEKWEKYRVNPKEFDIKKKLQK